MMRIVGWRAPARLPCISGPFPALSPADVTIRLGPDTEDRRLPAPTALIRKGTLHAQIENQGRHCGRHRRFSTCPRDAGRRRPARTMLAAPPLAAGGAHRRTG